MSRDDKRPDGYDALPKRFKDYIGQLESRVCALQSDRPTDRETRIRIVNVMARHHKERETYLPDKTTIAFKVGKGWIEARVAEGLRGDVLELRGEWGGLAVYPSSSNVVHVGEADYAAWAEAGRKK